MEVSPFHEFFLLYSTFWKNQLMHFESRSPHTPSDLSAEKRKEKKHCPACWKSCTVELVDLESKCMDRFSQKVLYLKINFIIFSFSSFRVPSVHEVRYGQAKSPVLQPLRRNPVPTAERKHQAVPRAAGETLRPFFK